MTHGPGLRHPAGAPRPDHDLSSRRMPSQKQAVFVGQSLESLPGSIPGLPRLDSSVVEQSADNRSVAGSTPAPSLSFHDRGCTSNTRRSRNAQAPAAGPVRQLGLAGGKTNGRMRQAGHPAHHGAGRAANRTPPNVSPQAPRRLPAGPVLTGPTTHQGA